MSATHTHSFTQQVIAGKKSSDEQNVCKWKQSSNIPRQKNPLNMLYNRRKMEFKYEHIYCSPLPPLTIVLVVGFVTHCQQLT